MVLYLDPKPSGKHQFDLEDGAGGGIAAASAFAP